MWLGQVGFLPTSIGAGGRCCPQLARDGSGLMGLSFSFHCFFARRAESVQIEIILFRL